MERYTIYCTEEQIKKALKLGAKIKKERVGKCITDGLPRLGSEPEEDKYDYLIPTAEQMIGWLEEQGVVVILVSILDGDTLSYRWGIHSFQYDDYFNDRSNMTYSRQEATLAAIDAALDYLIKRKK